MDPEAPLHESWMLIESLALYIHEF
jgi:hypothetical protein